MEEGGGFARAELTGGRRRYRPPSIREVSLRVRTWEDFRVGFYDWLDDFYRFPEERERMVWDEIAPLPDRRLEAFMAAAVHHLCLRHGLRVPSWVNDERYCLPDPWFYPPELACHTVRGESRGVSAEEHLHVRQRAGEVLTGGIEGRSLRFWPSWANGSPGLACGGQMVVVDK